MVQDQILKTDDSFYYIM